MIDEALRNIGLTQGERKVYLALLDLGSTTTGDITKKSRVSGSKVYEVLDRLREKGFANVITKNGVKYFEAAEPYRILDYLKEKESRLAKEKLEIQKILPELMLRRKSTVKNDVKVFTGWEGLKTAEEDILESLDKGEEWLSMGLAHQPKEWEIYFTEKHVERAAKGIILKHLLNEKYRSLYHARKHMANTYFRFLPKEMEMPMSTEIYKNKVLIFILEKECPLAIIIENKFAAESFRKYFKTLWNSAKK